MTAQESKLANAYESSIVSALTADSSGTTISVDAAPTDSSNTAITGSVVMYLVLDPDSDSSREYVKVTNISGTTLTVVRNIDTGGGGLRTHAAGAKIRQVAQAQHFDDIHDRIDKIINEGGTAVVTTGVVKDEDDMASDSATHLATQQSIKKYVDDTVTAQDLDFQGDSGGALNIDLDSETLTIAGGTGIDTTGSGNQVSVDIDSTVTTNSGSQSLTNKTIDVDNNTVSNIEVDNLKSGVLDTDISSVAGTDTTIPSAKAVKTYVDAQVDTKDTLAELDDVTIASVGDNEVLAYDNSSSKFINQTASEASLATSAQGALADSAVQPASSDTLTNKSIDVDNNTVTNIEVDNLKSGVLDTDLSSVSGSDDTIPSAKATKAYVDDVAQTTEEVQDIVGAMFSGNTETRVSVTYDDSDGTIDVVVDDMTADTQLTTEQVQDIVGGMLSGNTETRIAVTYDDSDGTIDFVVDDMTADTQLTTEQVQDIVGAMFTGNTETRISASYEDGDGTIDLVVDDMTANTQLTTEEVQDIVGAMFTGNTETNITVTYEDSDGTIDLVATGNTTEQIQDIVGAMFTGNTETGITATYEDGDGTIDLVVSASSDVVKDADNDTKIQVEESADEDKIRYDVAGSEVAVQDKGGVALTADGGIFRHNQTQNSTYTIAATEGAVCAGPITIGSGTVTVAGTMVIL